MHQGLRDPGQGVCLGGAGRTWVGQPGQVVGGSSRKGNENPCGFPERPFRGDLGKNKVGEGRALCMAQGGTG